MGDVSKRCYGPAQPGTSNATLYTAPAGGTVIRSIHAQNNDPAAASCYFSLGIGGTSATAANDFLYRFDLAAGETWDWNGFLFLPGSSTLTGLAETASALTLIVSGIEVGTSAETPKLMYGPAQPTNANATLYTAPSRSVVRSIHIQNTDTVSRTISLGVNGSSAFASNCFLYQQELGPFETYDWHGFLELSTAHTITGQASASATCTVCISGIENTT